MHYPIANDLYLVQQSIPAVLDEEPKHQPTNHLWIVDRSGSMYSILPTLIKQLQTVLHSIPKGDSISFGYFSSEGTYRFVIKGFSLNSESDYEKVSAMLEEHKRTLGLTCFSEILADASNVIDDLQFITNRAALWFLTDGYPVVSNYSKEVNNIKTALTNLSGRLVASCFVGYGDFYNQELLADMAAWAGGISIHSSELPAAIENLTEFTTNAGMRSPRQVVQLPAGATLAFIIKEDGLETYKPDGGQIYVPCTAHDYDLYSLCTEPSEGTDELAVVVWTDAVYAAASLLLVNRPYAAEDLMAAMGDIYFINALSKAFSVEEYGRLSTELRQAAIYPAHRHKEGYQAGFKPDPNAFCILDLVDLLTKDDEAYFFPYHQDFRYKRTGAPSKPKEGYPAFTPVQNPGCPFQNVIWHSSKLNLSIQARINGIVDLGEEAIALGLPQHYGTWVTRNYTIINDGALWTTQIPMTFSLDTYNKLWSEGLVSADPWEPGKIYTLDLSKLPIINRAIAQMVEENVTAEQVAALAYQDEKHGAALKVLKELLKQKTGEESKLPDTYTPEQKAFLESKGVRHYGFSPQTTQEKSGDYYLARTFDIKVKGFSSLPKVADVVTKLTNKKTLNGPAQAMADAYQEATTQMVLLNEEEGVQYLEDTIYMHKAQQRRIRHTIQRVKFSLLLGKRWFPDIDKEDLPVITLPGGQQVLFEFSEMKVEV